MSNRHRLEALRKRIGILRNRVANDQQILTDLERRACFLSATIAVEELPPDRRDALVFGSQSTNSVARKPLVR